MPLYTFALRSNAAIEKDFFFPIGKAPKVGELVKIEGKKWIRLFSKNVSGRVKGSENPCSANEFVHKTARMKGTVGNVMDEAKEQSAKRAAKSSDGKDPLQKQWFKDYSKKRHGKKHPLDN